MILNRLLRRFGAHWQNLSADDGVRRWPRHGRAWLHRGDRSYGFEWALFKFRCGFSVGTEEQGRGDRHPRGSRVAPAALAVGLPAPDQLLARHPERHPVRGQGRELLGLRNGRAVRLLGIDAGVCRRERGRQRDAQSRALRDAAGDPRGRAEDGALAGLYLTPIRAPVALGRARPIPPAPTPPPRPASTP